MAKVTKAKNTNSKELKSSSKSVSGVESKNTAKRNKKSSKDVASKPPVKLKLSEKTEVTKSSAQTTTRKRAYVKKDRPIIQVKKLVKKYNNVTAVDSISFDVKKGEIFGILGPNGAGKTTTIEMIETIIPKTSGQIFIDGLNVDTYPDHVKKIVGIQLQNSGFYPRINLIETLDLFADIYDVDISPMELLKTVDLDHKAKNTPSQLSGGQQKRFSIACTLVSNPLILFLDEPTTGLDPQARRNLWDTITNLKHRGKTIVLTTHYMDEAEALCDRIAIMDDGHLLEINTTEALVDNLLAKGFKRPEPKLGATLEDVFLHLTGKQLRE